MASPEITFGVSGGILTVTCVSLYALFLCYKRLDKTTRTRLKAIGKITFVFVQILVALPLVLNITFPSPFPELLNVLNLPALNWAIDNMGVSCWLNTDHYSQLLTVTLAPPAFIVLIFCKIDLEPEPMPHA